MIKNFWFKKIVKELHPDTVGPVENNKEKLVKILEAYKVIKEHHGKYGQAKIGRAHV